RSGRADQARHVAGGARDVDPPRPRGRSRHRSGYGFVIHFTAISRAPHRRFTRARTDWRLQSTHRSYAMRNLRKSLVVLAAVAVMPLAHAGEHGKKDIVDTAVAAGNFGTLVTAVQAADLVDTLKGEGPFTV